MSSKGTVHARRLECVMGHGECPKCVGAVLVMVMMNGVGCGWMTSSRCANTNKQWTCAKQHNNVVASNFYDSMNTCLNKKVPWYRMFHTVLSSLAYVLFNQPAGCQNPDC
jgi:hypothetical protein